jgi:hypothetical protein
MDQYGLAYLCLATIYVGWSICKYMIKRWGTRDHIQSIAHSLAAIQARLDSTRIEGVCVCHACAAASLADPSAAIGVVESRRASVVSVIVDSHTKTETGQNAV